MLPITKAVRVSTGRIHVGAFYMRRILRIWPLYFSVFFGLALLNHVIPGTGTENRHAWLAFSFLCANWFVSRHGFVAAPIDPLWSVSIEEQFYLFIPLLATLFGRRAMFYVSYVLLAIAVGVEVFYGLHPGGIGEWTNSFLQFQFFCAGTLIALILGGRVLPLSMPVRIGGCVVGFLCWLTLKWFAGSGAGWPVASSIGSWTLLLVGTVLIFLSTLGIPARMVPRWLSYGGKISYGLYVYHGLMLFLVFKVTDHYGRPWLQRGRPYETAVQGFGILAALTLDLIVAHLSYVYFEGFFIRLKKRFTFVVSRD
ncbi:MAG: acyltransferase [Acidobacteriaceae bacterium]